MKNTKQFFLTLFHNITGFTEFLISTRLSKTLKSSLYVTDWRLEYGLLCWSYFYLTISAYIPDRALSACCLWSSVRCEDAHASLFTITLFHSCRTWWLAPGFP